MKLSTKIVINDATIETPSSSSGLQGRHSVFEISSNGKARGRVYFVLACLSCLLMFGIAIYLVTLPRYAWYMPNTPGHQYGVIEPCTINTTVTECVVWCVGISDTHPGHVAAQYILSIVPHYQSHCDDKWELTFELCKFPNNLVDRAWMQVEGSEDLPVIARLTLNNCGALAQVEGGAFSSHPFQLERLTLQANKHLKRLTASITENLHQLKHFNWRQNAILEYAETEAFNPFNSSLEVLELLGGFADASVMARLVGKCQSPLRHVLTFDARDSASVGLRQLGRAQVLALQSVQLMFLTRSGIEHLEDNVFVPMAKSVVQINLDTNALTTMSKQVLDPLVGTGRNITLLLADNDWRCDCRLRWLQELLLNDSTKLTIGDTPRCYSPESEYDKTLLEANMSSCEALAPPPANLNISCNALPTTTTTTIKPTTTMETTRTSPTTHPTPTIPTVGVLCDDYQTSNTVCQNSHRLKRYSIYISIYFPTQIPDFQVIEKPNDGFEDVVIRVITGIKSGSKNKERLVWSDSDGNIVGCYENLPHEICVTKNITYDTTYLFCILMDNLYYTFPTHCKTIKTQPAWNDRSWLTNEAQKIAIPLIIIILILSIAIGAGIVAFSFWRQPALLRFNKRVVVVENGKRNILVMPEEDNVDVESVSSDPSYVSVVNFSNTNLFVHRFREMLRRNESNSVESSLPQAGPQGVHPNINHPISSQL